MLALFATYAVLLVCWCLVMRRYARDAARPGPEPEAHAPGAPDDAGPWAQLDAAVGPAGPPRGAASTWWPPLS